MLLGGSHVPIRDLRAPQYVDRERGWPSGWCVKRCRVVSAGSVLSSYDAAASAAV